jgi:hypothetical protein
MQKRRSPRLAQGQYSARVPAENLALKNARFRLLETIRRLYPDLLKALSAEVLPIYSHLAQTTPYSDCLLEVGCPARTTEEIELKSVFSKWADKFNINSDWLKDEALRALGCWHEHPESLAALKWCPHPVFMRMVVTAEPFEFHAAAWELELQSWPAYRESVRSEFETKLAEYRKIAHDRAKLRGLVETPHKYSPENLEWFVWYQLAGLSSTEIAKRSKHKDSVDESTVLKGIKAAAKLVGWASMRASNASRRRKIR